MKSTVTLLTALILAGMAQAGEVYVTRDAQGNPVYTDTPQSIPAQRLGIHSAPSNAAETQARYDEQMKQYAAADEASTKAAAAAAQEAKARTLNADDRARRCAEARERYQAVMDSFRLYEQGADGERRYLTSEEIDTARVEAKRMMDEFCAAN
jgi:hypothetical protein